MTGLTIDVVGLEDVTAYLREFGDAAERDVVKEVTKAALRINTRVKRAIQKGPRTGHTYTRRKGSNLSATHRASAPGEAPITDTGRLVGSIYFKQESRMSATVGSDLAYAYALEYGTSRMLARPAWAPAVDAERDKLASGIRRAMKARAAK